MGMSFDVTEAFERGTSSAHQALADRCEALAVVINTNADVMAELQAYVLALESRLAALEAGQGKP
jgi:hypothetical protein